MTPTASLIITSYNRSPYLPSAIESVLKQTYPDFELLIWDDGSTDLSPQIARYYALRDARIRVKAAQHQGVAPALKAAIAATRGQYIGWVDSDDLLAPTALEQTIAILNTHPNVGLVYTNYHIIDQQGHDRGLGKRCRTPYSPEKLLVDFMTFHFRLMRRSVYDQVGGIDASYQRAEDYDLCLRLSEVTEFRHLPQPLYFYRRHSDNLTNDTLELIRWSHQASTQALQRRGLDQDYTIDLQVSSKFRLKRKSTAASCNLLEQNGTAPMSGSSEPNRSLLQQKPVARSSPSGLSQSLRSGSSDATPIHPAEHYTYTPDLWLVTAYFNPSHYQTKRANYQRFKQRITAAGLNLLTVECAFGNAAFDLTDAPNVLQLRCTDVMWQKERLLNLALDRLPPQATKVAWVDGDILFANPNWAVDTVRLLDQFPVVQLFSQSIRLLQGQTFYDGSAEGQWHSFAAVHTQQPERISKGNARNHGHTGFAWATRREIWQKHRLYDALIVGAGDHLMAHAMRNDFHSPCIRQLLGVHSPQLAHFCHWGEAFYRDVQGRIGCVPGTVLHLWHGNLPNRQYVARHDKLTQFAFDPERDIKIGQSGAWEWCSDKPELHQWVIEYFHQRREDGKDATTCVEMI